MLYPLSYAKLAPGDGTRTRDHLCDEEIVPYAAVSPAAEATGAGLYARLLRNTTGSAS